MEAAGVGKVLVLFMNHERKKKGLSESITNLLWTAPIRKNRIRKLQVDHICLYTYKKIYDLCSLFLSYNFILLFGIFILSGSVLNSSLLAKPISGFLPSNQAPEIPKQNQAPEIPKQNQAPEIPTGDFLSYDNRNFGYRIQYPTDWNVSGDPDNVHITNPDESAALDIYIDDLSAGNDLKQYLANSVDFADTGGFKLVKSNTNSILGGHPAFLLQYTDKESISDDCCEDLEMGAIVNGKGYHLDYFGEDTIDEFTKNLPVAQEMIRSLDIYGGVTNSSQ